MPAARRAGPRPERIVLRISLIVGQTVNPVGGEARRIRSTENRLDGIKVLVVVADIPIFKEAASISEGVTLANGTIGTERIGIRHGHGVEVRVQRIQKRR